MAVGMITDNELTSPDSVLPNNQLKDIFNERLINKLPAYMHPYDYLLIPKIPLSINGKTDASQLPEYQHKNHKVTVSPRNQNEQIISTIWSELLLLPINKINIQDDFFSLGGNSLHVITLMLRLQKTFNQTITIAQIFSNRTIEKQAKLFQRCLPYQPIIHLNSTTDKPKLYMIHPGAAGCEVYSSLALALDCYYTCYGIDSYNLHHEDKINELRILAGQYLNYIDTTQDHPTTPTGYHLFGWSLGGLICLQIAALLEERHCQNIQLHVLDTVVSDDVLKGFAEQISAEDEKKSYYKQASALAHDKQYVKMITSNLSVERKITNQTISGKLTHTKITLYKAMQRSNDLDICEYDQMFDYIISLPDNNIGKLVENMDQIQIIPMLSSHHYDILQSESEILEHLVM